MERKDYIGSSDARDILTGEWDKLFRIKTGRMDPPDFEDNFAVQLGRQTEAFHLDWTTRRLNEEHGGGFEWSFNQEDGEQHFATFTPDGSENSPVLGSTPDALLRTPQKEVYAVEAKITGRWKNADEAADWYMPQLQHHMLVWDKKLILFSVICGTTEPERIWVGASEEWRQHYIERCDAFWRHIKADEAPAPAFYDDAKQPEVVPAKVAATVPLNGYKKRDLTQNNHANALIPEFIETKRQKDRHEEVKKEIQGLMADDENLLTHPKMTIKRDKRGAIRINLAKDAA